MRALKKVAVWHNVSNEVFQSEIQPLYEPAILKGYVNQWPAVQKATQGPDSFFDYLATIYAGGPVRYAKMPTYENGRFFYNQSMTGFNFERLVGSYEEFIELLRKAESGPKCQTVAIQSAPIKDYYPKFLQENQFTLFTENLVERCWIGGASTVQAHYDDAENIACVVQGERRFTLFPPEQVENLYVGPLEFTPAGAPISMVDFSKPDFELFPKFKTALNHALVAELEPGDAIYIPSLWWHHVESLSPTNMLVNFWSGGSIAGKTKPVPADTLLMALMTIKDLPTEQRKGWQALFKHYVFEDNARDKAHIPSERLGVRGEINEKLSQNVRQWLISQLSKKG